MTSQSNPRQIAGKFYVKCLQRDTRDRQHSLFAEIPGLQLLLFFRVDDFDMSLKRARALVARLEEEPHANPNTRTEEFSLRDPDGYYVTISSLTSLELSGHDAPA